jgi:hypothetical protein
MDYEIVDINHNQTEFFFADDSDDSSEDNSKEASVQSDALGGLAGQLFKVCQSAIGFEGRRLIGITNKTGKNIKVKFHKEKENSVDNDVTDHYSINPKDGILTNNYKCIVWFGDKKLEFWAYGKRMARQNNMFEITPEGIIVKKNEQIPEDTLIMKWPTHSNN